MTTETETPTRAAFDRVLILGYEGENVRIIDGMDFAAAFPFDIQNPLMSDNNTPQDAVNGLERILVMLKRADLILTSDFQALKTALQTAPMVVQLMQQVATQQMEEHKQQQEANRIAATLRGPLRQTRP